MGKYTQLKEYLESLAETQIKLSFFEIIKIIGEPLPNSAYEHRAWWGNNADHSHARMWLEAGWKVEKVDQVACFVIFIKKEELRPQSTTIQVSIKKSKVFVVHGHDDEMKHAVARTIEKLGLEPVILHEKPNMGRTIIEKFTDYSGVLFAIVLLSPDDKVGADNSEIVKFRARQNVILELGYFLGKLGRENVFILYKQDQNFEMPSDYSGILYTPYNQKGLWRYELVRELQNCGYEVDANRLLQ